MANVLLILGGDSDQAARIGGYISEQGYAACHLTAWDDLLGQVPAEGVLLIDLDTVATSGRSLDELKRRHPRLVVLTASDQPFHPHLSQALQRHVFAMLGKPIDPEELLFWLRSANRAGKSTPKADNDFANS
ncbi:MAG: hypothetical protein C4525_09265 [Desulfarculus sp.]|jgi:DNA-binding NtrC family response regulator|nr:MAG: hypothetical protein C4525_09265 [Desulfarculus sp.]